jgi:hypothetical protein
VSGRPSFPRPRCAGGGDDGVGDYCIGSNDAGEFWHRCGGVDLSGRDVHLRARPIAVPVGGVIRDDRIVVRHGAGQPFGGTAELHPTQLGDLELVDLPVSV